MRILLVCQYYYPERVSVSDIAEGLVKLGHKVSVVTGKPNYGFGRILPEYKNIKYEIINGVEVYRINLKPRKKGHLSVSLNYLSFHRNAKRFVRHLKQDFDVVLSITLSPITAIAPAVLYSKKHNVPHVHFCEDLWPESTVVTKAIRMNSLAYKILYKWSKSLYESCDEIMISSPSFKDYFTNVLHLENKKFVHVNQPILVSKSNKLEPITYSDKFNIVYAGNIGRIQLVDNLLDAMKLLKGKGIKLHLMGMGSLLESIKKRIINEKLDDAVEYHGALPIEKAESYYVNADALVVSLKNEGYVGKTIPNKAIQYLKYARPILGVIEGDGKDLLSKANGSIFASEDSKDIAKAIESVVNLSKEEKDSMGQNNLNYFNDNLAVDKIVKNIEKELYSSIDIKRNN